MLGRVYSKTLPDGSLTEGALYDLNNNLTSLTGYNSKTATFNYDTLNRLVSRVPDPTLTEPTVSFTYTATGLPQTMVDGSGTTTFTYDTLDRLITKATPEGTLNYTYDAAGNVASVSSSEANGVSVSYTYDDQNRLSTVVDNRLPSGSNTTTYTYDPASNLAKGTYPNGLQATYTYDQLNRLSQLATNVSSYGYQRDANGNKTSSTEGNGRTTNWNYDGIDQLTGETIGSAPSGKNGSSSYGLDPVGNRESLTSGLSGISSGSWVYNVDDQPSSESYDQNGNVLVTSGKTFAYDSQNHLTSMNGGAVQVLYDGEGNRVAKSVNGVVTRYLVDDLNPTGYPQVVEELAGNGALQREYTYGLQRISENQVISNTWTPSFYQYDGGGSTRLLTNAAGAVTDSYEYDAFGNEISNAGSTPNEYLYRGEQYDSDLSMYYLRARYYNPVTGRFLSQDPDPGDVYNPPSLHRYRYAAGNPTNFVDPSGQDTVGEYALNVVGTVGRVGTPIIGFALEVACAYNTEAAGMAVINHWGQSRVNDAIGLVSFGLNFATCTAFGAGAGEGGFPEEPGFEPGEPGGAPPEGEPPPNSGEGESITNCPLCFAAGTPVHTEHGNVPIELIKVGERVVARDQLTGKEELKPVTALVPEHKGTLVEVQIEGEQHTLRPSLAHPLWVKRSESDTGHWIEAKNLRPGELVETIDGGWRKIESVKYDDGKETVYNFTVDKDHDYFVGETGFLVHNTECPCGLKFTDRMTPGDFRRLAKDIKQNGILDKVIKYVTIAGQNYIVGGNNRLTAARQLGLGDQLEYEQVQLPYKGFQTEEDVLNNAADYLSGGSCMY